MASNLLPDLDEKAETSKQTKTIIETAEDGDHAWSADIRSNSACMNAVITAHIVKAVKHSVPTASWKNKRVALAYRYA